uniref:TNF receptor-associated factor n=1 Tax=Paramormyrops kingsleyae TaxID=1676925 RepID=A0A3B3STW3_9TELE
VPRGPAAPGLRQDIPRPRTGAADPRIEHPLHPQRGGLSLDRAGEAAAGISGLGGEGLLLKGRPLRADSVTALHVCSELSLGYKLHRLVSCSPALCIPIASSSSSSSVPQGHFSTCSYNVIPCPNRCATKLTRRELPAHLQHDCTKRQVRCEHCGDDFTGAAYEEHQGVCPQESVYCENKCGARLARRLLGRHGATECPKRTLPCRHCGKGFVWDTLQNHQYQCPQFLVSCPHQCGAVSLTREELTAHVRDGCNTSQVICPFREAGCKHRGPKVAMSRHLEDMAKAHLNLMCGMVNRQRQEILELRREVEEMSAGRCGAFLWKVADYTRQFQEARRHSNSECLSPTFCSHRYGYRLQASAFLDGNGSGEGSFLSLYIRVLPGEYDNLLEWPFPGRVTFSLLDQSDPSFSKPQHIIETFNPDPSWKNFQRPRAGRPTCDPTDESALGFGYPKFISHEEIRKRNYIRDDAIFLKVSVDIPQKIIA